MKDSRLETADRATIVALQLKELRTLLERVWQENEFYREHWRAAGVSGPASRPR